MLSNALSISNKRLTDNSLCVILQVGNHIDTYIILVQRIAHQYLIYNIYISISSSLFFSMIWKIKDDFPVFEIYKWFKPSPSLFWDIGPGFEEFLYFRVTTILPCCLRAAKMLVSCMLCEAKRWLCIAHLILLKVKISFVFAQFRVANIILFFTSTSWTVVVVMLPTTFFRSPILLVLLLQKGANIIDSLAELFSKVFFLCFNLLVTLHICSLYIF